MNKIVKYLLLTLLLCSYSASGEVAVSENDFFMAFWQAFSQPERFRSSGVFQLLGYDEDDIALISNVTPRPASLSIELFGGDGNGGYDLIKVTTHKVKYYGLTIGKAIFEFPDCEVCHESLSNGYLRFTRATRIGLVTFVSEEDLLKVLEMFAKARSLHSLRFNLEKNQARLRGRVKRGIISIQFKLKGEALVVDEKTVDFRCDRLVLNGQPLPRNMINSMFSSINPVFDASKTWLNLNIEKIKIHDGAVETTATIAPKKG